MLDYTKKYLTINPYSRPAKKLKKIKGIVIHWIASPRGTPEGVYNWFENRKDGKTGYGSAHFSIGIDGRVFQFIPQQEMAYHVGSKTYTELGLSISNYPNDSTIGIELCHLDWEGSFSDETLESAKILTALLLKTYNLTTDNIYTHNEIVGWKDCPRWFVNHPEDFEDFRNEVSIITLLEQAKALGPVNVREEPSVKGRKMAILGRNEIVDILGIINGWYKIKTDEDIVGYVNQNYITSLF